MSAKPSMASLIAPSGTLMLPFRCSIGLDGIIPYNSLNGENNGDYLSVCSKGSFTLLPPLTGLSCPLPMHVNRESCEAAALSIGGKLQDGTLLDGSYDSVLFGCSIHSEAGSETYYNSNTNGINDGNYTSICHKLPVRKFIMALCSHLYFLPLY